MKLVVLIVGLASASLLLLSPRQDISGTWVLDTNGKTFEPAILKIKMQQGYFSGRLDIPDQQLYDQPVSIRLDKARVKVLLDHGGTCFIEGVVSDSLIIGNSFVENKGTAVKFRRIVAH